MTARGERLQNACLAALCFTAVCAAFAPCLSNGFVSWDDPINVVDNVHIRAFTAANLRWMLGPSMLGLLMPLHWLSLAADFRIWGLEPAGYHLDSVLWQAAGAVLWFGFWRRLFQLASPEAEPWDAGLAAAFAALAFAVHPLRVESVAWVTERRDVVSGFFFAASLWLYLEYVSRKTRSGSLFAASIVCQAAALLGKPTAVCLPAALIVLDVFPLRRFNLKTLAEKTPFLILAAAASVVNWRWHAQAGALHGLAEHGLWDRLARASFALIFYPAKTLWPAKLLPIYELPHPYDPWSLRCLAWVAAAALAAVGTWRLSRRRPAVGAAAVYYAAAVLPVSGLFVQGIPHLAFDRYSYLPCLGFSGLAGALVLHGLKRKRRAALAAAILVLSLLGALSWRRCRVWRSGETLWRDALAKEPDCEQAHVNLAVELSQRGLWEQAATQAGLAVPLDNDDVLAWKNLGAADLALNRLEDAQVAFAAASSLDPRDADARRGLARAMAADGKADVALEQLASAIALRPDEAALRLDQGQILLGLGRRGDASRSFEEALRLDPGLPEAHIDLGLILQGEKKFEEAAGHYRAALHGGPNPEALFDWGNLEALRGRYGKASRLYAEALRVEPDFSAAAENLRRVSSARKRD